MRRTTPPARPIRGRTPPAPAPRRPPRRRAPRRLPRWPAAAALAYGLAVGLSSLSWAVAVRQLVPQAARAAGPWLHGPVLPLVATAVALVASAGFALALRLRVDPRDRRTPVQAMRACGWAGLAGAAFPWLSGLLLPAWLAASGGHASWCAEWSVGCTDVGSVVWPLWVWCFAGSMIAGAGVHRLLVRTPHQETS